ncbi:hypothetical protein [Thermosyntropha sp.]|uniref:hypothetical protein n=1 Tax=Thermosyntropha sp. TaxID=2740820 RepID=UPI0025FEAF7E|nr:hypothetical protein [Thermosyntropha sp.]MBO8159245.1 hypothetical protein [Thermosyntropha sp.]
MNYLKKLLHNEKGISLPIVLLLFVPIVILAYSALNLSTAQNSFISKYDSGVNALHYAEAGINHYLWSLNKTETSFPHLNREVPFENGKYMVTVLEQGEGYVKIKSTGWTDKEPNIKRTITAVLAKRNFTRYSYFSDNDPSEIRWVSSDIVYGPYHTNGDLVIDGNPTFYGRVTYSGRIHFYNGVWKGGASDPDFNGPYPVNGSYPKFMKGIQWAAPLEFPLSNSQLKIRAQNGGYYYEGRTSIRLNPDGTVTIRNKTNPAETKPLPSNGVIYIDGTTGNENRKFNLNMGNAFVAGTLKGKLTIAAANDIYITGRDPVNYTFNSASAVGTGGISGGGGITYAGTTFTEVRENGVLTGYKANGDDMLGLVANNNILILCKGWFDNPDPDVRWSWGWHYDPQIDAAPDKANVYAAVFAINGSFGFEKLNNSSPYWLIYSGFFKDEYIKKDTIFLRGALIQKTRGEVGESIGTIHTGYRSKNYAYDDRMTFEAPPHFIEPSNQGWEIISWQES